jgi:muconolactone delta-isomerase
VKILGVSRRMPGATFDDLQKLQKQEAGTVWRWQEEGFLREIYFDPDKPAVAIILEAPSIEAVQARLAELPMVGAKLIDFDLMVLGHYRQLGVLFATE